VQGMDPAKAAAAKAESDGIPTRIGWLTWSSASGLRMDYGHADIITANHVMANVEDLHEFTRGVKELLAPDGTFVFETGYWPVIVEHNLIDTIEHEHIHYFAVEPLQRFFLRHGLQLVHVETNSAKGGSLRGYVQHANGQKPEQSVSDMIAVETHRDSGTNCKDVVTRWAIGQRIGQLEKNIKTMLAASEGETWVGYGAAVGSTLLLHQFGLGEKLLCLVDSNPQKQGRLSPGYHLRVVDPSELAAINPDKIVILAWRYAELIMAQHPEFKGKWLIPLPNVVTQ
jgi:hypothetical protein